MKITSLSNLPLSWARTQADIPIFDTVNLPLTSVQWIPLAEVPHNLPFEELYQSYLHPHSNGVVLQSINVALRDYLIGQGWQAAALGAEAILDLPWRGKRSVRELARRGRRQAKRAESIAQVLTRLQKKAELAWDLPSAKSWQP